MACFRDLRTVAGLLLTVGILFMVGCSKQEFKTAPVSGVCKCKGVPMTAGILILTPVQDEKSEKKKVNIGKPARALIQSDGSFKMSTFGNGDGAVIGPHMVRLNLAELDENDPVQPCKEKDVAEGLTLTVQPGNNVIELELVGD